MRSAFWVKEQWRRLPTEWLGCVLVVYRYRLEQDHRDRSSLNSPEPQERCVGKHDHTFESVIMAHVAKQSPQPLTLVERAGQIASASRFSTGCFNSQFLRGT